MGLKQRRVLIGVKSVIKILAVIGMICIVLFVISFIILVWFDSSRIERILKPICGVFFLLAVIAGGIVLATSVITDVLKGNLI